MDSQLSDIEYLETRTEDGLPSFLSDLSEADHAAMRRYVEAIIDRQEAGLNRLFEAMGAAMGFIPKIAIVSLTLRFVEPPICARITRVLEFKQIIRIGNALPVDYLVEVSRYQATDLAASIVQGLKPDLAQSVLMGLTVQYPYHAIDLAPLLAQRWQSVIAHSLRWEDLEQERLASPHRAHSAQLLQSLKP